MCIRTWTGDGPVSFALSSLDRHFLSICVVYIPSCRLFSSGLHVRVIIYFLLIEWIPLRMHKFSMNARFG